MTLAVSNLTSGNDTDLGTTATTASVSHAANAGALLVVWEFYSSTPAAATATSSGRTWSAIDSQTVTGTGFGARLNVLQSRATGATSGAITITLGQAGNSVCCWSVTEITGLVGGATWWRNVVKATVSSGSPSATYGSFASANNFCWAATGSSFSLGDGCTPRTNWTELVEAAEGLGSSGMETQYRGANDTAASATWAGGPVATGIVALELIDAVFDPSQLARYRRDALLLM